MATLMNGSKMYTINRGNKSLSCSERMGERTMHYVIGFNSLVMARKVQYSIAPEPYIRLERRATIDVTNDVNDGLEKLDKPHVRSDVIIDVEARLYIPKFTSGQSCLDPENDGGFHLNNMPIEDFIMMPFERNLGVIMPYKIDDENNKELVFVSHVIEPSQDFKSFFKANINL